jgi:hypothetical protein
MRNQRSKTQKLPTSYNEGWQKALANQDFFEIEAIKHLVNSFGNPRLPDKPDTDRQQVSYFKINI